MLHETCHSPSVDMLKFVLLLCAVAGFNARPLKHSAVRIIGAPLPVHDEQEHMGNSGPAKQHRQETEPQSEVVLDPVHAVMMQENVNQKLASTEEKQQGTEPSRRFLVDLNTGLLKEYISEMERRAEVYKPALHPLFRQGTQNSRVTLVDIRTGKQLPQLTEMQRRASPLPEFRQGTEYSELMLMKLRKAHMEKGLESTQDTNQEANHKAVPPEFRRQGTEPSRRILVDLNTGLVKEYISEMKRRISGFYNPASNPEFRQGTQNSRVVLVDVRLGKQLPVLSEMQRSASPLPEFRQGTEYSELMLMKLRKAHIAKGLESTQDTNQEANHKAVPPEFRRQGTEPSRRILVDLNTGLVKEYISEMKRRISGFYNPASNPEFRQGTQNSRVVLVDVIRRQPLPEVSEMQRRAVPELFRQGTEHSLWTLVNLRKEQLAEAGNDKTQHTVQDLASNEVFPEYKRGIEYSQSQRQHIVEPLVSQPLESNEVDNSSPLEEYRHGLEYRHANAIDRGIM